MTFLLLTSCTDYYLMEEYAEKEVITIKQSCGHILIDMYVNDKGPYQFLLDTGAPHTLLSEEFVRKHDIDYDFKAKLPVYGLGGAVSAKYAKLDSIGSKHFKLKNLFVTINNMKVWRNYHGSIAGIVGLDFFAELNMVFDLARNRLTLYNINAFNKNEKWDHSLDLQYKDLRLFVSGVLDKNKVMLIVDTGFLGFLDVSGKHFPKDKKNITLTGMGLKNPVVFKVAKAKSFALQSLNFKDIVVGYFFEKTGSGKEVPLNFPNADGLLGIEFFSFYKVGIHFKENKIYLKKIKSPSKDDFSFYSTGVNAIMKEDGYYVVDIFDEAVKRENKILINDRIIKINGIDVIPYAKVCEYWQKQDKKQKKNKKGQKKLSEKTKYTILRKGKHITVTLKYKKYL